tara:strand:- start:586 stop:1848 length:1263 start_codon:yes stop_codon:yes gene_type:complete
MLNRKALFGLVIIAFAAVAAYFAIDYVAKKEIKLAVDKYQSDYLPDDLSEYIEINYDAGVSGLFVPTIKNLKVNIVYENLPKDVLSINIDEIKLYSYDIKDYDVALINLHVLYDKATLQQYLLEELDLSMNETGYLSSLDYMKNIDLYVDGTCSSTRCEAGTKILVKSLFLLDQNFKIDGSEDLIAFYLDNLVNPMDPSEIEENPFIIFEALGLLSELNEISFDINYKDYGLFDETGLKKYIQETYEINNFQIEEGAFGISYLDNDLTVNSEINTSLFKNTSSMDYVFDSSKLMIEPDQAVKLANVKFSLDNSGLDDVLWQLNPFYSKDEILSQVDIIIDEMNQDTALKDEFMESEEGYIITQLTGENDPLKSLIMVRNFIDNPNSIDIEYEPRRPVDLMEIEEMMNSPEWPVGMNIAIK